MWFLGRLVLGGVVAAVGAGGTAWFVANYVTDRYHAGLEIGIGQLAQNVDELGDTVRQVDTELRAEVRRFSDGQADLAARIAEQVVAATTRDGVRDQELRLLREDLIRIESGLSEVRARLVGGAETGDVRVIQAVRDESLRRAHGIADGVPVFIQVGPLER